MGLIYILNEFEAAAFQWVRATVSNSMQHCIYAVQTSFSTVKCNINAEMLNCTTLAFSFLNVQM